MFKKVLPIVLSFFALCLTSCNFLDEDNGNISYTPNIPGNPFIENGDISKPDDSKDDEDDYIPEPDLEPNIDGENNVPQNPSLDKYPVGEFKTDKDGFQKITYQTIAEVNGDTSVIPSHGSPNIIVVPINFSDLMPKYTFDFSNRQLLETVFNGSKEDGTNDYWESVSSFYKKTSYGQLDMHFRIADPFTPSISSSRFRALENNSNNGTYVVLNELYGEITYNSELIDFHDPLYDINNDGYVDGVWLIYNEPTRNLGDAYWPYAFKYFKTLQDNKPDNNISAYANCALSFCFNNSTNGDDAHVLIHETGHMLGLDDYYTYDYGGSIIGALGGLDMMDFNIGDHNAFSKTALGWITPRIPTKPGKFTLKPQWSDGDAILLPNYNTFNGSAFSEYLLLEYYQPYGLNYLDANNIYDNGWVTFQNSGLKILHVDARLLNCKIVGINQYSIIDYAFIDRYTSLKDAKGENEAFLMANRNTRSQSYQNSSNDLVALISADKEDIYANKIASNNSLFKTGDVFNYEEYKNFFYYGGFDDNTPLDYSVEILRVDKDEITLNINF